MLTAEPGRGQVSCKDTVPRLKADFKRRVVLRIDHAGIIVNDVNASKLLMNALIGFPNLRLIRELHLNRKRADRVIFPIDANNNSALVGELPRNPLAYSACSTRYYADSAGETSIFD